MEAKNHAVKFKGIDRKCSLKQHWQEHINSIDWQNHKKQLSLFEMLIVGTVETQSSHHKVTATSMQRKFSQISYQKFHATEPLAVFYTSLKMLS